MLGAYLAQQFDAGSRADRQARMMAGEPMDVIATHLNADFDGLASMVAARKLYPGAVLVFPGGAQETVRSFLAVHDLGLARLKELDLQAVTRLIVVDTQEPERLGPLKPLYANPAVAVHIFDHHPAAAGEASEGRCQADLKVVAPVGATTTVLIEQLLQRGMPLSPFEATVLALGLYEETGSFSFVSTTPRDLEAAAAVLRAGADLTVVADTLRQPLDADQIALLNALLQQSETYYLEGYKVLLATSSNERYHGDLAEVVHKLAELKGLDAVVAAIAMDDKIEIIGRSRRSGIDVAQIAAEFGGGGHAVAAAASVKNRTMVEVREQLVHLLTERYRPTLLAQDVMTTPVKTVAAETTIAETEQCLTRYGVNVLPVLDQQEHYCGVISREIVQKALFDGFATASVQTFLQTDQYTARPETPFQDIERQMLERNQRFVPIVSGTPPAQKVLGVITRTDLLRTLHEDVLAAARVRAKGQLSADTAPLFHRQVQHLLRTHLPSRLYAVLERAGQLADTRGESAYIVGGCVRDLLLGMRTLDVDVVVEGDGLAFARALATQEGASVTTNARFGTAVLHFPAGFKLDIATARTEYYEYPTALPTVKQSSIKKDLYRRDFTINTLAIRLNARHFGELIDFYGGQRDLKDKTLRVLHSLSFMEDPTRVFRAIWFEVRFGFHVGKETLRLIKGAVKMALFQCLSGARLGEELRLLLAEPEARKAVARLAELDLLRFVQAEVAWSPQLDCLLKSVDDVLAWYQVASLNWPVDTKPRGSPVERPGDAVALWLVRLMALLDAVSDTAVDEALRRLRLSGRQTETVLAARAARHTLPRLAKRPLPPAETYRLLSGQRLEVLLFCMAKTPSAAAQQQIAAYLETYRYMRPHLSGRDLHAMGLTPGPQFRTLLSRLLEACLNGEVSTEAEERALVQRLVGGQ
jgi:tRNA nucleotidyltransferase (CCA-adding enzyme)